MKRKNEKKKMKKSNLILLLLAFSIMLLITASYAWFTSNKIVHINSFDVNVATGAGMTISTDASDWGTIVTNDDILQGYSVNGLEDTNVLPDQETYINPVSTDGSIANGKLNMYKGVVDGKTGILSLTATKEVEPSETSTNGNYAVFDVFIKNDAPGSLYLGTGSGVKVKTGNDGLEYSARIAIVNEGLTEDTSLSQYTFINTYAATSVGQSSDVIILEPNYDGHTKDGINQAKSYYSNYHYGSMDTLLSGATLKEESSGNSIIITDGIKNSVSTAIELSKTNAIDSPDYFSPVTTTGLSNAFCTSTTGTNQLLYSDFAAGVHKFRIYMWVEGQDVDCENAASGSQIEFSLNFSLNSETE